jgi:hypothetical protein
MILSFGVHFMMFHRDTWGIKSTLCKIFWQRTQSSFSEQQIDIFQADLFGLLEEEKDDWEGDNDVPCCKDNRLVKK